MPLLKVKCAKCSKETEVIVKMGVLPGALQPPVAIGQDCECGADLWERLMDKGGACFQINMRGITVF